MSSSSPSTAKPDAETTIKRNPHPDFKTVESSRPDFNTSSKFHYTKTPDPTWTPGSGPNTQPPPSTPHREIDPYAPGRPATHNYKLLISSIIPRPVGFVSTLSSTGVANLAPFSYFNLISHDPPLFVLGFSGGFTRPKDTLSNLVETGECVINMISEDFIEAANYTCINAPAGVSEWDLSGLTKEECAVVKCKRVKEAVFSVEAKLVETREWESRMEPGRKTGVMAVVEGARFWVREDAVDDEGVLVDPKVLKPISRLGGITFGRTTEAFELPRPNYEDVIKDPEVAKLVKKEGSL